MKVRVLTAFVVIVWLSVCHWCTTEEPTTQHLDAFREMMSQVGLEKYFPTIEKTVMKKMAMAKIDDSDLLSKMRCINAEVKKISELMKQDRVELPQNIDKLLRMILTFLRPEMNNLTFSNDTLRDVYSMTDDNIREYNRLCQESRDIFFQLDFRFNKEMQ